MQVDPPDGLCSFFWHNSMVKGPCLVLVIE
jgi:hypothetical protein